MNDIFSNSDLCVGFHNPHERDFFIQGIGYNNFKYLEPTAESRVQDMYTLHYVLLGSGTLNTAGMHFEISAPCIFFLPPDTPISYYPHKDDLWQYVWFECVGEKTEIYARLLGLSAEMPIVPMNNFDKSLECIRRLFRPMDDGAAIGYYSALSAFYALIDINGEDFHEINTQFSDTVISYLHRNYHNPRLTAEKICRDFRISHSYICKIFLKETGKPLIKHLIEIRISEACRLLRTTSLRVKEVAFSVGFADEIYFMKCFKKHMRLTPKEYRKKYLDNGKHTNLFAK